MKISSGKSLVLACVSFLLATQLAAKTTKKLSEYGFTKGDSTTAIQKALDADTHADVLIVDVVSDGPWITNSPLYIPSNIEIIFEKKAEIQAKHDYFTGTSDILFNLNLVENVIIHTQKATEDEEIAEANRGVLRMWPEDYDDETKYVHAEWRHSISIKSSKNIKIYDMNLEGSGGDGMYLGVARKGAYPTDIHIWNVKCDHHYRQGLSVIAGINCLFENVEFLNTKGTAPQAGVDFEPNQEYEPIANFTLKNCRAYKNAGCGYAFYLPNGTVDADPLEITLDGCIGDSDKGAEIAFTRQNGSGFDRPGYVIFKNCTFQNNASNISLNGPNGNGFSMIFDNVVLKNLATSSTPISIGFEASSTGTAGNLHFNNTSVYFSGNYRKPFTFTNGSLVGGIVNLTGSIMCYGSNGQKEYKLPEGWDDNWEENYKPDTSVPVVPYLSISDMEFEPLTPNTAPESSTFDPYYLRDKGTWLVYGKKGQLLTVTLANDQFTSGTTGSAAAVTISKPSGDSVSLGEVPFKSSKTFKTTLSETGLHTLNMTVTDQMCHVAYCNLPIVFEIKTSTQKFAKCNGTSYFYVPEDAEEFAVDFIGSSGESLTASLYDPNGQEVFNQSGIAKTVRKAAPYDFPVVTGIWKIEVADAKEDMDFRIYGIPPLLGLDPNLLLKEKK